MAEQRNFERIVSYGQDETANIQGEIVDCAPFLRFRWHEAGGEWKEVLTHLVGAYNLDNMLAAIAIRFAFWRFNTTNLPRIRKLCAEQ